MVSLELFIDIILPTALWPWGDSACNRYEYREYFLEGKGGRYVGLTTLTPSRADCLEIWEPQPPGTLGASTGFFYLFTATTSTETVNTTSTNTSNTTTGNTISIGFVVVLVMVVVVEVVVVVLVLIIVGIEDVIVKAVVVSIVVTTVVPVASA